MGFLWVWTHLLRCIHQSLNEIFVWLYLWELVKVSAKMILSLGTCKTYIVIDAFWKAPEISGLYRPNQFKYSQVLMTSFLSAKSLETLPEAVQPLSYNLMHFMHSLSINKEICEKMRIAQISYASLCFFINFCLGLSLHKHLSSR